MEYGIGVYALEKNKMVDGQPDARAVSFFLDGNDPNIVPLVGDYTAAGQASSSAGWQTRIASFRLPGC